MSLDPQSPQHDLLMQGRAGSGVTAFELGFEGHRFEDGIVNETYRIDSPDGPTVLKVYHPKNRAHAEKEASVLLALQRSVAVPRPLAWGDGIVQGRTALQMDYWPHPNARLLRRQLADSFFASAAETLGRIHTDKAARDVWPMLADWSQRHLGTKCVQPFEQFCRQVEGWLQKLQQEGADSANLLSVLLSRMLNHQRFFPAAAGTLVHGDYSLPNLLTDGRTVLAVIDFESTTISDPSWDLHNFGQTILDTGFSGAIADAFLATYDKAFGLPAFFEERRNFYRYYKGFQLAMRHRYRARLGNQPAEASDPKLDRLLTGLLEYSDAWLSSKERGVL